jgi:hypothetical protein
MCSSIAGKGALLSLTIAVGLFLSGTSKGSDGGWTSLFDGATLNGWVQQGVFSEPFRVQDGQIVGPSARNAFLCTTRDYADFILELEVRIPVPLNSGIQLRSHRFDHETKLEWNGKVIVVPAGRVHGYQIEIDPSKRAWTGGFYEEGRRGWIQNLEKNEAARQAFRPGEWNTLRIECRGDAIKTWINGVPASDVRDTIDRSGFIALQVAHGGQKAEKPLEVRFRNIRIKELP